MNKEITLHLIKEHKFRISIAIIWLLNILAGIVIVSGLENTFMPFTPLSLTIIFALILWHGDFKKEILLALGIPVIIGTIVSFLGVNYGFIFGDYAFGDNLGVKIFGVPLMIGFNWSILVFATSSISKLISNNSILAATAGAVLMTSLDIIMEISAPRFGYWEFKLGVAPVKNYVSWFIISFIAHLIFQKVLKTDHFMLSFHIFTAMTLFFSVFILI